MALLPALRGEYTQREVTDSFLGYDHRPKIPDGAFYETKNLTGAQSPLLAVRPKRGHVKALSAPAGLLAAEKLAWVDSGTLWYDGAATALTGLTNGEKQLVSMGARIVVFPDKRYYNTADPGDLGSLEASYSSTGAVDFTLCRLDGTAYAVPAVSADAPEEPDNGDTWVDTGGEKHVLRQYSAAAAEWVEIPTVYTCVRFVSCGELPGLFRANDGVTIAGAAADCVNGDKILLAVGGDANTRDYIVVAGLLEEALTQTAGSVSIRREVPDMDFVIQCQNRLWGCRYGKTGGKMLNEIYCCALGDFTNWRQYMGLSTDSWTASVGSDGPWTGAISYLGSPLFFKEDRLHRVSVSSVGAHQLSETLCRGVQQGSAKSLQVVGDTLFYKSRAEVCAYQGGFPQSISEALGDELYSAAVGGSVGERYYLSMLDKSGAPALFVYDIRRALWMHEDGFRPTAFARLGDELYALEGKQLWAMLGSTGTLEPFVPWEAETGMLCYQYPDRKYLSRFNLRLWMEEGAELEVFLQYDSAGPWVRQGRIRSRGTRTVTLPVRPRRCDHLRIRICGRGEVRLYSLARILAMGSDVG